MVQKNFWTRALLCLLAASMTNCQSFHATVPALQSVSVNSIKAGIGPITIDLYGSNFDQQTTAMWNGSDRATTYLSSTHLQAAITAADTINPGSAQIVVRTALSGSALYSNALVVNIYSALQITTSSLHNGKLAAAYSGSLTANGGTAPYSWTLLSGSLPSGISLSTAGAISGTPMAAGTFTFAVQAKDSAANPQTATASLSVTVIPPALQVSTTNVPGATMNVAYTTALSAAGGTQPYTWLVSAGQLPNGIGLSSSGVVSGTAAVSGTFPFTAEVRDNSGSTATANLSLFVSTSNSGFHRWFADTSFWNTPIPTNPAIDTNSAAILAAAVTPFVGSATFSNSDAWGISYIDGTNISAKTYTVACTQFCTGDTINFPIPAGAQPTTGSDHHLVVINGTQELDMWLASYDATTDSWSAGVRVINDITGWGAYCALGQHCNGAEASGFALLGGDIRPEEINQGHIDHALAMITPYTETGYIACPATHTDGTYNAPAMPEGARVQLDPSFNVDAQSWPAWEKTIAKALQVYGAYIVDTGGALAVRGVTDQNLGSDSWASVNTPKAPSISDLPWDKVRVLQIQSCN